MSLTLVSTSTMKETSKSRNHWYPSIILDMANSHMGDVAIGKRIIDHCVESVKFQYRDLSILGKTETRHHKRFRETHLDDAERKTLVDYAKRQGLTVIITPFDEISVDQAVRHGTDILKVASCSADDWPLLEKIAETGLPVIASTGGMLWKEMDRLYYFLKNRNVKFMLMHCVAEYPTPPDHMNLSMIRKMKERYGVPVGYSGHEAGIYQTSYAISAGADVIERHISDFKEYKNDYSIDIKDLNMFVGHLELARLRMTTTDPERKCENLSELQRDADGTMPRINAPVKEMRDVVHEYEAMLRKAKVPVNGIKELSHHRGIDKLRKTGAFLMTVINTEYYAKKIICLLPGQSHPSHKHFKKDETFHVLSGDLIVNGTTLTLGDVYHVAPGVYHSFSSVGGCVFEEISTHAEPNDSEYADPAIQMLDPSERKTALEE